MTTTRSVSVELLGNTVVTGSNATTTFASNPATVGLSGGGFATAVDNDSDGITVTFSNAAGAYVDSYFVRASDPSMARLSSGAVALVGTTPEGQILVTRDTAATHLASITIGTGSNADIATSNRFDPGYAVAWERSDGGIVLVIAATDDATTLTQVVVASSTNQIEHDPSVARLANGNYVVAWTQYGSAGFDSTFYAIYKSNGELVTPATFVGGTDEPRTVHPSVATYGNDFTITFEDNEAGAYNIAQYTRTDDGRNVTYRQYDTPGGSQDREPDTATVGALHVTAFTSNFYDGEDIRGQELVLGLSEPGTGTLLTDADNLVHVAADGSQASVAAIPGGNTGRLVVSYYDGFGGEVRQQQARVRETITGDASNQTLQGRYGVAVSIDGGGGDDTLSDGDGDDKLFGNTGNDILQSRDSDYGTYSGNDLFDGGDGNDTLDFSSFFGSIKASLAITGPQNTNAGLDTILRIENLTGSGFGEDQLTGNDGANVLDDGGPNRYGSSVLKDTLIGGLGSDTYVVTDSVDVVIETSAAGGIDLVKSRGSFTLSANVENLTLLAQAGIASATGNGLANVLTGNNVANVLNGMGGSDTMIGGAGSDTYTVDNSGDRCIEANGASGIDLVYASVSYGLGGSELENLTLTGTAGINGTGNSIANVLTGNAAANVLNGLGGADRMIGAAGSDTYFVDTVGDRCIEANGASGIDLVYASVSYGLGGSELENLTLTGAGSLAGTGNSIANGLKGNMGANVLDGLAGSDTLTGLAGKDTFVFSTALGATNIDRLADFSHADDTIRLAKSVFAALSAGTLAAGAFKDLGVDGAKIDADDRILYNHDTGALSYDVDGSGAKAAVQFATLLNKPTNLAFDDFSIV